MPQVARTVVRRQRRPLVGQDPGYHPPHRMVFSWDIGPLYLARFAELLTGTGG